MKHRLAELVSPLMRWYVVSILWAVFAGASAMLIIFRAFKTSAIAAMIEFEDVPLLASCEEHYVTLYWSTATAGALFVFVLALMTVSQYRIDSRRRLALGQTLLSCAMLALVLVSCRYSYDDSSIGYTIAAGKILDWLALAAAACTSMMLPRVMASHVDSELPGEVAMPAAEGGWLPARLAIAYLLGCTVFMAFAYLDHVKFWDPDLNGGYDYEKFFVVGELAQANLVLYSTSLLFASLAALAGCAILLLFRVLTRSGRRADLAFTAQDCRRFSFVLAGLWAFSLVVPWQIKLLPEIQAENGWILPAVSCVFLFAALRPLIFVTGLMLQSDFARMASSFTPRRSEFAFWMLLLFPVYPLLRLFRLEQARMHHTFLMVPAAALVLVLVWGANEVDRLFDFEDWRGMLRSAQIPFLRVLFAMLSAYFVYLYVTNLAVALNGGSLSRLFPGRERLAGRLLVHTVRLSMFAAGLAVFAFAMWPFWGWQNVGHNVFARTVEFNHRHEFELRFLHWMFDLDRDGYAAVLHGADPDDFDGNVQAGGLGPPEIVDLPIDEFVVADADKARQFPNLVIFYLEGVIPRSISAYGARNLPDGLQATPAMDEVARDGTLFRNARCHYPSTWDAWFAVSSGRFLRIKEMDSSKPFKDRYSRYANLYSILRQTEISRWCHADTAPYADLLVPEDLRPAVEPGATGDRTTYDTWVTEEERERDVWRGDKRCDRMIAFLDSLKPGERFFMCEHMSDTHFPWERTAKERAVELGFPNGLDDYEYDADLPAGFRDDKYSRYFQTITRMDAQIGRILKKLKDKNLYDNTMIVIVSDHGCQWWEHEHMYYVGHLYEQSLLVPMIIKAPGLPGGGSCDVPVLQTDLLPTVMELAGMRHINPRPDFPMTSRSLAPLLRQPVPTPEIARRYRERDVILTTHYDTFGVISQFHHKLIFDRPSGTYLLFDLQADPGETRNLADERPDLLEQLTGKLHNLMIRNKVLYGQIKDADPSLNPRRKIAGR